MKVGIITYCDMIQNYGSMLQCFALQRFLRNKGHDAFFINYDQAIDKVIKRNPLWLRVLHALNPYIFFRYFYSKFFINNNNRKQQYSAESVRQFKVFMDKYVNKSFLEYKCFDDLKKNPPEADAYVVGSDQVWNAGFALHNPAKTHIVFLDFGSKTVRRVSYAASWGKEEYPEEYIELVRPLIKKFDFVSVREKTGVDLCRKAGFEKAKWVCDPTLLLTAEEYRRLYTENSVYRREKKYLLMYILGAMADCNMKAVRAFAKSKGLEVVLVPVYYCPLKGVTKVYPTIPEWLSLIDNAEYVLTNSFHGCVFSTIFGKRYAAFHFKKVGPGTETRIDSLFECCHIEPRWLNKGEGFSVLDKPYTADLSVFRQESLQFLNEALDVTQ